MKQLIGCLQKMRAELGAPVQYWMRLDEQEIHLNPLLQQPLRLEFTGAIHCIQCGKKTKQSFQQGYCYPCMLRLQECNMCIIHPERCLVEHGNCSAEDWAHSHCHAQHVVYLANSSGLKVGITRHTNSPTRWLDQGAFQALPIFYAGHRYQAGLIEVAFKKHVYDKTHWQAMLKKQPESINLAAERDRLCALVKEDLAALQQRYSHITPVAKAEIVQCDYPVLQYPSKISSHNLDKNPVVEGRLQGIKGQYLLLDTGVINLRKFGGYQVRVEV